MMSEGRVDYTVEWDEQSMGEAREHYVFPSLPKKPYDKANVPNITGGFYVKKGTPIPEIIVLTINRRTE
jgi:hypothetical protein